jgi:hypothetical protein
VGTAPAAAAAAVEMRGNLRDPGDSTAAISGADKGARGFEAPDEVGPSVGKQGQATGVVYVVAAAEALHGMAKETDLEAGAEAAAVPSLE